MIKAYAPRVNEDYCLAICGNQKILGDWNPDKALLMSDINFPEWQTELDAGKLSFLSSTNSYSTTKKKNMSKYGKTIPTVIWQSRN